MPKFTVSLHLYSGGISEIVDIEATSLDDVEAWAHSVWRHAREIEVIQQEEDQLSGDAKFNSGEAL